MAEGVQGVSATSRVRADGGLASGLEGDGLSRHGVDRLTPQVLLAAFLDAPMAVGVCDEDGKFVALSRSLARLLRRRPEEIIGRPYLAFVHPDQRPASLALYFEAVVAAAAGVRQGSRTLRFLAGDGAVIDALVNWSITEPDEHCDQYGIIYLTDQRSMTS